MHPTAGYPNANGGAWLEGHHGWWEFGINVHGIRTLAGKRVAVTVHGDFVGRMRVSQRGSHRGVVAEDEVRLSLRIE